MTKGSLITGFTFLFIDIASLLAVIWTDSRLESLLIGLADGGIIPGCATIIKYFYWNQPMNKERYKARLENERIEQNDELKSKLRDKSSRYAYVFRIVTIFISIFVFYILGAYEVIDNVRIMVLYLAGYLAIQITAGMVFFNQILKNLNIQYRRTCQR